MIEVMRDRIIALIDDFRRTILTFDWNYKLYNHPLWKHIYHALYWFDYWYCTPENFINADFATVSGKVDNLTSPEALYRKCGFVGDDV